MSSFVMMSEDAVSEVMSRMKSSTCVLDPVPTKLFKSCFHSLSQVTTSIINSSLNSGIFPTAFKTSMVKPLLKKSNLDNSELSNYRPISNLPFLGKLLEKIVFNQLLVHLTNNGILEKL